jgi:hypothetical protein
VKKSFAIFLLVLAAFMFINAPTIASARGGGHMSPEQREEWKKRIKEHEDKLKDEAAKAEAVKQKKDAEAGITKSTNRHITIITTPSNDPSKKITKIIEVKNSREGVICHSIAYNNEEGQEVIVGMGCVNERK